METEDTTTGGKDGEGKDGGGKMARILARTLWLQEWSAANPNADAAARKAAWQAAKGPRVKDARKLLRRLEKNGLAFTLTETAAGTSEDDSED